MAIRTQTSESPNGQAKPLTEDEAIEKLEQEMLSELQTPAGEASVEAASETSESKPKSEQESAEKSKTEAAKTPPETITLSEFEARKDQALRDQRAGLEKGHADRLAQERERLRVELAREAEEARLAKMTDAERGALEKDKAARTRLKDELRPEVQQEVISTLNAEIGPMVMQAMGYPVDPTEWAAPTKAAWNERIASGTFTFTDRLRFLHEDALTRARSDKDAEWQKTLDKALGDQKAEFDKSLGETRGAAERGEESELRIVGEGGVAVGFTDLERKYADGTATPEEQRAYQKQLVSMGVFAGR